jgi:hypothetical protein
MLSRSLAKNTTAGEEEDAPFAKASTPQVRLAGQLGGAVFLIGTVLLIIYWVRKNKADKTAYECAN